MLVELLQYNPVVDEHDVVPQRQEASLAVALLVSVHGRPIAHVLVASVQYNTPVDVQSVDPHLHGKLFGVSPLVSPHGKRTVVSQPSIALLLVSSFCSLQVTFVHVLASEQSVQVPPVTVGHVGHSSSQEQDALINEVT